MLNIFYIDSLRLAPTGFPLEPDSVGEIVRLIDEGHYTFVGRLASDNVEEAFREFNVVDGSEIPCELQARSMSVGDLVLAGNQAWLCASIGFDQLSQDVAEKLAALVPANPPVLACRCR
jgi:hypothetical protein